MKIVLYFFLLFFLVFLTCGCPAPREDYVVVNTSEEILQLIYEVPDCSLNPTWENWMPKILSHNDFLKGQPWENDIPSNIYSISVNTKKNENMNNECKAALYKINVPKETAVRIVLEDFHAVNQISYLKMDGVNGTVTFERANSTLRDCFEKYKARFFSGTQNVIWY